MGMKRSSHRIGWVAGLLALALVSAGCNRSPEARSAKYMAEGKRLLEKKDPARAILQFRNAAQATPKDPEVYYQLALATLAAGDFRTGVATLRKALDLDPKHAGARLKLAELMSYADDPGVLKDAQQRLQGLVEEAPENANALQALALTDLKLGEGDDAMRLLQRASAAQPQDVVIAVTIAEAKLGERDAKGAEGVLKKLVADSPNSPDALVVLGRFYVSQNRQSEAEQQFQGALKLNRDHAAALMNLGLLQYRVGQKEDAERTFKRLSELPDKSFKASYATYLYEVGRRDEAVREYEKLFKEFPDDRMTRTRLVTAYCSVNRVDDAAKVLARALEKNPKDVDARLQHGELSLATGKYEDAEADLNKVLQFQPNSPQAHYVKAQLNRVRGRSQTYHQELSEVLRLDPYLLAARLELARVFVAINEPKAAAKLLDETPPSQRGALSVTIERNWVLWALHDLPAMRKGIDAGLSRARAEGLLVQDGFWKLRSGNPGGARDVLEEALKINPADIRALSALRESYGALKQDAAGLKKIQEYAAKQPKSAPLQQYLGFQLMMGQDRAGAAAAFAAAEAAQPGYAPAELSQAVLDITKNKLDDAAARLTKVLAADSGNVPARLLLGKIRDRQGNHAAAVEEFQKVVDESANNVEALNNLAYLLAEHTTRTNEALKYAQKAQELAPDNPEYADTLGWILYRKGMYPSAIAQLGTAAAHPGNAVWKYHLAMAYVKAGDIGRGRSTLDAALKLDPELPEAKIAKEMVAASKLGVSLVFLHPLSGESALECFPKSKVLGAQGLGGNLLSATN